MYHIWHNIVVTGLLTFGIVAVATSPSTEGRIVYNKTLLARAAVVAPIQINNAGWTVTADSSQDGNPASNVLDGDATTFWHSQYNPNLATFPHNLTIDMKNVRVVNGLTYLPRQDGSLNGNIGQHSIYLSLDGTNWGSAVATGTYANDATLKTTFFVANTARYVLITIQGDAQGDTNQWASAAEITVLTGPKPSLPRTNWQVSADSSEPAPAYNSPQDAIDGATTTIWHTRYDGDNVPGFPHIFTIDQSSAISVSGLSYLPRPPGSANGRIGGYRVEYSTDNTKWNIAASGTWADDANLKFVEFAPLSARYFRLVALSEAGGRGPWTSAAEINLLDGSGAVVDFLVSADSEETTNANNTAVLASDGNKNTFWHTQYSGQAPAYPHTYTIDMRASYSLKGLEYLPRQDGSNNGNIGAFKLDVSADSSTWVTVATGTFYDDQSKKLLTFGVTTARYIRLTALSEAGNRGAWASAAEITPLIYYKDQAPAPATYGRWDATIDFPIVPAAGALLPNNKLLVWSAYEADNFGGTNGVTTLTAQYDYTTGTVSQRTVSNTNHDMFCPGLSVDGRGRPIVTGGNSASKTSIYDSSSDTWITAAQMQIARGYQASATLSNGQIFTIGGSWSGDTTNGNKNGEIYDPAKDTWTLLPGCLVGPMLTNDIQKVYRQDNHGWLFGWKNATVFQAGPSAAMNWYYTTGNGNQIAAGKRASDPDAMNGNAVMFDAVNGKILSVGGAQNYQNSQATTNAHVITINTPGTTATATKIASMSYSRSFANSIVLPDGTVFIVGGQTWAVPFADDTAIMYPELFNPSSNTFKTLAPMRVARVYHSIAILLPDATIISGGGGLCDTCDTNHFDAEIFSPPYLFNSDGSKATRPAITSISATSGVVAVGAKITIKTSVAVSSFSLVRYGSATHTVDTDQRRVPLTATNAGTLTYTVTLPADAGILLPGYWMLFALTSAGVPSVAQTIRVTI